MLTYKEIQVLSQIIQSIEQASSKLEEASNSKNLENFETTKKLLLTLQIQIKNEIEILKK